MICSYLLSWINFLICYFSYCLYGDMVSQLTLKHIFSQHIILLYVNLLIVYFSLNILKRAWSYEHLMLPFFFSFHIFLMLERFSRFVRLSWCLRYGRSPDRQPVRLRNFFTTTGSGEVRHFSLSLSQRRLQMTMLSFREPPHGREVDPRNTNGRKIRNLNDICNASVWLQVRIELFWSTLGPCLSLYKNGLQKESK